MIINKGPHDAPYKDLDTMSKKYILNHNCGIALTKQGKDRELAKKFYEFVQSEDGAHIFTIWGWIKPKKK
jgi:ABC-type molybdate transport system substrate-binding protein